MYFAKKNLQQQIVISVISDLVTDQRVQKVATTLHNNGYKITVIGANKRNSKPLPSSPYTAQRINLFFNKGFLFYAEWNLRLFFKLFFLKKHILLANDLDTLLPNFLHSKWSKAKLVYDSHEYFIEQEELQGRNFVKNVWQILEEYIFPKLKNVYTVNDSIANIYAKKYAVKVAVIKNLPQHKKTELPDGQIVELLTKQLIDKKIILTQGTGFNSNRGLEELVAAMEFVDESFCLVIIGSGLIIEEVKKNAIHKKNVFFINTVSPAQLNWITKLSYLGCTLDKATCLNYEYALPNKLFDYIQANVPIVASNRVEVANIVNNNIGIVIENVTPTTIAATINQITNEQYKIWKNNVAILSTQYTWEMQESKLLQIFNDLK